MPFISISIDICGSTDAKTRLLKHSKCIKTEATTLYDSFQRQILRVEETFWTMLRSSKLDLERLFLIKSIGDEVWYAYDLENLNECENWASISRIIEAVISLQTKQFDIVAGPPEDPYNWEGVDSNTILRIELPLKVTVDLITDALDISTIREKYLAPHVATLLSPLDVPEKPIQTGNDSYIKLCNRLGISNQVKTKDKVLSTTRTDYIGWEIDRFFRITKSAIEGAVLIGPEILTIFDTNDLIVNIGQETLGKPNWTINDILIKVCVGENSFTSLKDYILARKYLPASEQKGVGEGCNIGIIYWKYQKNVEINNYLQ